ncbi:hypothetical protein AQUCO_01100426v1, partial [Aquilegia coerulea]
LDIVPRGKTITSFPFSSILNSLVFAGLVLIIVVVLIYFFGNAVVWIFLACSKKSNNGMENEEDVVLEVLSDDDYENGTGPKRFTYAELLGEGGFRGVYRGVLSDSNLDVAVKRVSSRSKQGRKEFVSEPCYHLFGGRSILIWLLRYKIALALASALLYLHEEWEQYVVHRDIKSSNVILDSDFSAKLGDFGLARLVDHEQAVKTTMIAGTMGYLAPECLVTGKANLTFIVSELVVEPKEEASKVQLVAWVWKLYGSGKILEAADANLYMEFNEQQITQLMVVGLWCANLDHSLRPSIKQAISVLNFEAPLPDLPFKMSVPTYFTSSMKNLGFSYASGTATNTDSSL